MPEYVQIAVAAPVPRPLTYAVPESLAGRCPPGARVLVPLGRRRVTGYVLGPGEPPSGVRTRAVKDVLDDEPLFPASMLALFRWISDYYLYPLGLVLKEALPGGVNTTETLEVDLTDAGRDVLSDSGSKLRPAEMEVLRYLAETGPSKAADVEAACPLASRSTLGTLEGKGLVSLNRVVRKGRVRPRKEKWVRAHMIGEVPKKRVSAKDRVLHLISTHYEMSMAELRTLVPSASRAVRDLAGAGRVRVYEREVYRDPFGEEIQPDDPEAVVLTEEQQEAVDAVVGALDGGFSAFLLDGVTGSGKTEVYMRCVARAMEQGRNSLVLVPEIALISQIERRFRARFGDSVALLHSGLSDGERLDQWMRVRRGEARVAIGARSAVFAPFDDLGLVIVDEEHDDSYKQDSHLRYNGRDVAVVRAKLAGATAVLGSATPSIQATHNALIGKFTRIVLSRRVQDRPHPEIKVVDLSRASTGKARGPFMTDALVDEMAATLDRGEQVLLFLNRRGYANFPMCGACGNTLACDHCDISLTVHKGEGTYRCHYCGLEHDAVLGCTFCGSRDIRHVGVGTEKIETFVKKQFPKARVARMDRDTTMRKGDLVRILKGLRERSVDILIGTQMVTKGHDFPNITLVGVLCADLSLGFPDYRAGERTFQILAQVAGRAGRGDRPGIVYLQTYNPGHFCISTAKTQDYATFYDREIAYRRELGYPPYSRLAQVRFTGQDPDLTEEHANAVGEWMRRALERGPDAAAHIRVLGPVASPLARIADRYRWQILVKGMSTPVLRDYLARLSAALDGELKKGKVNVVLDVDPINML
ncbi:MAG: primosomal protein N' [Desulfatibacillaceae bacterium]